MTVHEIRVGSGEAGLHTGMSSDKLLRCFAGFGIEAYVAYEVDGCAPEEPCLDRLAKIEATAQTLRDQLAGIPDNSTVLEQAAVFGASAYYDSWRLRRTELKLEIAESNCVFEHTYMFEDEGLSPAVCDLVRDRAALRVETYESISKFTSVLDASAVQKAA